MTRSETQLWLHSLSFIDPSVPLTQDGNNHDARFSFPPERFVCTQNPQRASMIFLRYKDEDFDHPTLITPRKYLVQNISSAKAVIIFQKPSVPSIYTHHRHATRSGSSPRCLCYRQQRGIYFSSSLDGEAIYNANRTVVVCHANRHVASCDVIL